MMYKEILEKLYMGDASCLTREVIYNINQIVMSLINKEPLTKIEQDIVNDILHISNIIYNNTDRSILVLDDGIYDLLLVKYKRYNPNFQVGAEPISFNTTFGDVAKCDNQNNNIHSINPFVKVNINRNDMWYYDDIMRGNDHFHSKEFIDQNKGISNISKRLRSTTHKYPQLVGTLDKVKFVLDSEAIEKGVYNESNVQIFERDFLAKHVREGIINPNYIELVLELKYDGVSVEAEVTDSVISARTRGDTGMDKASDLTPILGDYQFPKAKGYNITPFGMKFEAIIDNYLLQIASEELGKKYVNPRNAIIGLFGRADSAKFAKYITLVPLATSHNNMNRVEEIEFMNKYYSTGEKLRYTVIRGDYNSVLYEVRRFTEEAERMRDVLPFAYDGIVVSYLDPRIREILGRKNSVNQYSVAIKFPTKKKLTRARSITYSVGSNGVITPKIWYDPVEFFGAIQTKTTLHSYDGFMKQGIKPGDVIQAEFVNDVMTYITKVNVEENFYNPNPPFKFITNCPECGQPLVVSESGKSVTCNNIDCPGRVRARMTNMIAKLGFKGFSEESIKALGVKSFYEFINISEDRAMILGEVNGQNLLVAINQFLTTPIADYTVVGSLGFNGIAITTWKVILQKVSLNEIITMDDLGLNNKLLQHKGIGTKTANVICRERHYFMKDLLFIYNNMSNVLFTKGNNDVYIQTRKVIRFSGIRDPELMMKVNSMGHDCSEGSVTKQTNILLVPYVGYSSGNVSKADKYGVKIIPIDEFKLNMTSYLNEI